MFGAALEMSTDLLLKTWMLRAGRLKQSIASVTPRLFGMGMRMTTYGACKKSESVHDACKSASRLVIIMMYLGEDAFKCWGP